MENKAQQKIPVLFTSICGNELYLVNNMDFKLLKIKVTSSRTTGCSLVTSSEKMFFNVKPRSIVKIDEFDQIVDSDYLIETIIEIFEFKDESMVSTNFRLYDKGGFVSNVLMFSD